MRVILRYHNPHGTNPLVWFTESKTGVYLGYYSDHPQHHHSLHGDGRRHVRTDLDVDLFPPGTDVPIKDHTLPRQLLNVSIPIEGRLTAKYPRLESKRPELVWTFTEKQLNGATSLLFDYYLMHKRSEQDFFDLLFRPLHSEFPPTSLLASFTIPLIHFPDQKVGFILRAVHVNVPKAA